MGCLIWTGHEPDDKFHSVFSLIAVASVFSAFMCGENPASNHIIGGCYVCRLLNFIASEHLPVLLLDSKAHHGSGWFDNHVQQDTP